jgi:hypothetical protein
LFCPDLKVGAIGGKPAEAGCNDGRCLDDLNLHMKIDMQRRCFFKVKVGLISMISGRKFWNSFYSVQNLVGLFGWMVFAIFAFVVLKKCFQS